MINDQLSYTQSSRRTTSYTLGVLKDQLIFFTDLNIAMFGFVLSLWGPEPFR